MYLNIANKNGLTLGNLRDVVQETEQFLEDTPIVIGKEVFTNDEEESDIDFVNVTEIIADEESIAFYH